MYREREEVAAQRRLAERACEALQRASAGIYIYIYIYSCNYIYK